MEDILMELRKLAADVSELKSKIEQYDLTKSFDKWIPRKKLMAFLNYEDTQMAALLKTGKLKVAEIGNRKFIEKESFLKFLENNSK